VTPADGADLADEVFVIPELPLDVPEAAAGAGFAAAGGAELALLEEVAGAGIEAAVELSVGADFLLLLVLLEEVSAGAAELEAAVVPDVAGAAAVDGAEASAVAGFLLFLLFFAEVSAGAAELEAAGALDAAGALVVEVSPVAASFLCLCFDFVVVVGVSAFWSDDGVDVVCAREDATKTGISTQRRATLVNMLWSGFIKSFHSF